MSHNKRTYIMHTIYFVYMYGYYHVTGYYVDRFTRHELAVKLNNCKCILNDYDRIADCDIIDPLYIHHITYRFNELCTRYVTHGNKRLSKDDVLRIKAEAEQIYQCHSRCKNRYNHPETFRDLPIPYVHRLHLGNWYRQPKLGRQRKQNNLGRYDEHYEFNNTKYAWKTLPTWDDRPRPYVKSWKDCTKRRHQYKEKAA